MKTLFTFILSCLLCTTLAFHVFSYFRELLVARSWSTQQHDRSQEYYTTDTFYVKLKTGRIVLSGQRVIFGDPNGNGFGLAVSKISASPEKLLRCKEFLGIWYRRAEPWSVEALETGLLQGFSMRLEPLLILFGVWPAICFCKRLARKSAVGCCGQCGYDLRATPIRCPECGTAVTASEKVSPVNWRRMMIKGLTITSTIVVFAICAIYMLSYRHEIDVKGESHSEFTWEQNGQLYHRVDKYCTTIHQGKLQTSSTWFYKMSKFGSRRLGISVVIDPMENDEPCGSNANPASVKPSDHPHWDYPVPKYAFNIRCEPIIMLLGIWPGVQLFRCLRTNRSRRQNARPHLTQSHLL